MSYDLPSVPDFLEHYDGIPEVVLGGACNAPSLRENRNAGVDCQPCPEEGCARGGRTLRARVVGIKPNPHRRKGKGKMMK